MSEQRQPSPDPDKPDAAGGRAPEASAADRASGGMAAALEQEGRRAKYGAWVVYAGLGVVVVSFIAAIIVYHSTAGDVSTALAPVTGVVGTIVGAYFGVQVGSQGKEMAEQRADDRVQNVEKARQRSEENAMRMAALALPESAAAVLGIKLPSTASEHSQPAPSSARPTGTKQSTGAEPVTGESKP